MPGIGKRAAQKIVATLKGKVIDKASDISLTPNLMPENSVINDALEVLVDLGYKVSDARNQINEVINGLENKDEVKAENLLKEVFKRSR